MIEKKELMLGDFVICGEGRHKGIVTVRAIGYIGINTERQHMAFGRVEPIPLSRDVMRAVSLADDRKSAEDEATRYWDTEVSFKVEGGALIPVSTHSKKHVVPIRYLHQLQNYYRVVVGEELLVYEHVLERVI